MVQAAIASGGGRVPARGAASPAVRGEIAAALAEGSAHGFDTSVTLDMIEATRDYENRAALIRDFVRQDPARAALVVRDLIRADMPEPRRTMANRRRPSTPLARPRRTDGSEAAAILLMLLGDDEAATILTAWSRTRSSISAARCSASPTSPRTGRDVFNIFMIAPAAAPHRLRRGAAIRGGDGQGARRRTRR